MKHFILITLLFLLMFNLSAEVLPEQQSAPIVRDIAPPVRYWSTHQQGLLPVQTLPGLDTQSQVPLRKDPKLLVVLYHNIVFGRTGNVYNRVLAHLPSLVFHVNLHPAVAKAVYVSYATG